MDAIADAFRKKWPSAGRTTFLAEWTLQEVQRRTGLGSNPSTVGIAREYSITLADDGSESTDVKRFGALAYWIRKALQLPSIAVAVPSR